MTPKAQVRRAGFDWPQIEFEAMQSFHVKHPTSFVAKATSATGRRNKANAQAWDDVLDRCTAKL